MQVHAQAASASCIQRIWRQHLEHKRYQALRQHPRAKAWRQQSAAVKAHLLQKVTSGNTSLMSAFCQPKQLQRRCQCMLESSIILLCSCTCLPAVCAHMALLFVTAFLVLAWQKCSVRMLWPAFVVYLRISWTKKATLTQPVLSGDVFVGKASWHYENVCTWCSCFTEECYTKQEIQQPSVKAHEKGMHCCI